VRLADPRRLRARLALWSGAVVSVVLVVFAVVVYHFAIVEPDQVVDAPDPVDAAEQEAARDNLLFVLAVSLPAAIVVAVIGSSLIARQVLAPFERAVAAASALSATNLSERIPIDDGSTVEVRQLVVALNGMLDRLEASVLALRRFTMDASHELRTPLSFVMGTLERALHRPRGADDVAVDIERSLERLNHLHGLLEALFTLARSDGGELRVDAQPALLHTVVDAALEPYLDLAADRGVVVQTRIDDGVRAHVDPLWLTRAIANLIDNAVKFTPPGGRITVVVADEAGVPVVVVEDDGPGVATAERERVFERFFRADTARATTVGVGLGLPLTREIVRALRGDVRCEEAASGGARFVVRLRPA
jgi:two-component system OmpR family sensor kinase